MGALIMLLVLIARNVQEQNIALAVERPTENSQKAEERLKTLKTETEDIDWLAAELVKSKKLAEGKLAEERAKLAAVEKETQKIKDELARLETIVKELDTNTSATSQQRDELKRLLDQKAAQREQMESELRKVQEELERNSKSYAIIPYRGSGGTNRRPIYLECTKDKVIIQPEGIVLEGLDFAAPDRPDNPVDAALRTIRQYYSENGLLPKGTEPYPLFIVRPSGVEVYADARANLGSWVNEYGYELVDEDWKVEFPPSNSELQGRIEKQIDVSRQRTGGYLAAMEMQRREAERPKFRMAPGGPQPIPTPGSPGGGYGPRSRMPNTLSDGGGSSIAQDRGTRNGIIKPAVPTPTPAPNAPPYTAQQPGPPEAPGTVKKDDDMISLAVPDPSKRNLAASPSETQQGIPQPPPAGMAAPPNASRGENWALKGARRNAVGVTRNVRIQIESDRLVLVPQPGLMLAHIIPIGNSIALAVDSMVEAINEFTESWETAGENQYWKPTLKVKVQPGGEEIFNDFQLLLRGSGLAVERM